MNYHQGFNAARLEAIGVESVVDSALLEQCQAFIQSVTVEDSIFNYIVSLAEASRTSHELVLGGSPRASIALLLASKTYAALQGTRLHFTRRCKISCTPCVSSSHSVET